MAAFGHNKNTPVQKRLRDEESGSVKKAVKIPARICCAAAMTTTFERFRESKRRI